MEYCGGGWLAQPVYGFYEKHKQRKITSRPDDANLQQQQICSGSVRGLHYQLGMSTRTRII